MCGAGSTPNEIKSLCICPENQTWSSKTNSCSCVENAYNNSITGGCSICTSGSTVNSAKTGCTCTAVNSEWMPMCNTCECIITAYNKSGVCTICGDGSHAHISQLKVSVTNQNILFGQLTIFVFAIL